MNVRKALPWVLLAAVAGFVAWKLHTSHFDWTSFGRSFQTADWRLLLLALLIVLMNYVFRAARWAVFIRRPESKTAGSKTAGSGTAGSKTAWWSLIGSQFVGFTGLCIFGRIGELIRPLLIARRTGLSFASQIAVVAVERVFDLGAFGLLFGLNLAISPGLQALPFHERFHQVGYAIAGLTVVVASFVIGVRVAGATVAKLMGRFVGMVSKSAGAAVSEKIMAFHGGLDVISGVGDFVAASAFSFGVWGTIAVSYVLVMKAFPPPVSNLTIAHILVLMGFSVVGSIVQLPGVGGGAQAMTIAALTLLFGIPQELAVSAGLMVWLITTMGVIPVGLVYAKVEGISLGQMAKSSEKAEEQGSGIREQGSGAGPV